MDAWWTYENVFYIFALKNIKSIESIQIGCYLFRSNWC